MLVRKVSRELRSTYRSLAAKVAGERWETCDIESIVPLADGTWSTIDGGQLWRRWNGNDYEYKQGEDPNTLHDEPLTLFVDKLIKRSGLNER